MTPFRLTVSSDATTAEVGFGPYVLHIAPADSAGFYLAIYPDTLPGDDDLPEPMREILLPEHWDVAAVGLGAEAIVAQLLRLAADAPQALLLNRTDRNPEHEEVAVAITESPGPGGEPDGVAIIQVRRSARDEAHTVMQWLPDAALQALETFLAERRERRERSEG